MFFLPEGGSVTTPAGTFGLGVRSRVNEANTNGHPRIVDQESLHIRFRVDASLLEKLRIATAVETIAAPTPHFPLFAYVENIDTGSDSLQFSVGNIVHVEGGRLSFDKSDPELGVFFVPVGGKAATRASVYSRIGMEVFGCRCRR